MEVAFSRPWSETLIMDHLSSRSRWQSFGSLERVPTSPLFRCTVSTHTADSEASSIAQIHRSEQVLRFPGYPELQDPRNVRLIREHSWSCSGRLSSRGLIVRRLATRKHGNKREEPTDCSILPQKPADSARRLHQASFRLALPIKIALAYHDKLYSKRSFTAHCCSPL